jgi:serine/threonine protein kinase
MALKFLPDLFTGDSERMARFEREAKLLASLNHPNITAIYGLEKADGGSLHSGAMRSAKFLPR